MSSRSFIEEVLASTRIEDRSTESLTVENQLFREGYSFEFFQAVRLLERLSPERGPVGHHHHPSSEAVRFTVHQSLSVPASAVSRVEQTDDAPSKMEVAFLGLTGPNGALPRHYTETLLRLEREGKGREKRASRAWFDLFNHRLVSLFYRAWQKYRFHLDFERGEAELPEPDSFTQALSSLMGLGMKPLRNRMRVTSWDPLGIEPTETILAEVPDLSLLRYTGLFAQRRRPASNLRSLLEDYFGVPIEIEEFQGEWLSIEAHDRSRLSFDDERNRLGSNAMLGEQVWEIQGKVRIRVGPLTYDQFEEFLPDESPTPRRKLFYLMGQVVRLYLGPTLDFDVQLILEADEVPESELGFSDEEGTRLGWDSWMPDSDSVDDVADAVFDGRERDWNA